MAEAGDDKDSEAGTLSGALSVAGKLIKAASRNPDVKAAGGELGRAALTIAKTINIALLPLAAVNFGYDNARAYFQSSFQSDLNEKLVGVTDDEVVEPKPSIAGPILQGLAFNHDEYTLKEMYLSLLASAMQRTKATNVHPAYVEIVKQLAAEEAALLCGTLSGLHPKPIVQVRLHTPALGIDSGWNLLLNHFMDTREPVTRKAIEVPRLDAMVDNWIRLGLIHVSYTETCAA